MHINASGLGHIRVWVQLLGFRDSIFRVHVLEFTTHPA